MSGGGAHLTLRPERCDHCGRCADACPVDAIKVGPSYIYVDWHACTKCNECVEACTRGAIERSVLPSGSTAARAVVPVGDVPKVVVGSRAEAKAVRKAAEQAEKARTKSAKSADKPRKVVPFPAARTPSTAPAVHAAAPSAAKARVTMPAAASPRREQGGPPIGSAEWTLLDAGVVLAVLLVTVLAKDWVLGLHPVSLMPAAGKEIVRAVVLAMYYSIQLGVFAWLASRHGAGLLGAFGMTRGEAGDARAASEVKKQPSAFGSLGLVLLLFVGTEAFSIAYGLAMERFGLAQPARLSSDLTAVFGGGGAGMAATVLLVALVAPFVEELAFRGVLLPVLGSRTPMWAAIGVSAAVYAAYHIELWLFVPTLVLGVALGWLAWTRRSLWPAIALHVLYNAAAVAAAFALTR